MKNSLNMNDLIRGIAGNDGLSDGTGNDVIFGSDAGSIDRPTSTTFTPPAVTGTQVTRGFSWVVDDTGSNNQVIRGATNIVPNGETVGNAIDGGAGSGNDIAHGGNDNDQILGLGKDDVLYGDVANQLNWRIAA